MRFPLVPLTFAAAAAALVLSFASGSARADLLPDGMTHVPVEITLDNQNAMPDTSLVLVGCSNPDGGRHSFDIAKPGTASKCNIKMGVTVYAIPTKDAKPLEELRAKDVGWAEEGQQVKKLTEKAKECGKMNENSLVETSKKITFLTARYSLEKTATGCSIKKVGETTSQTASNAPAMSGSAAPSGAPSGSPSGSPSGTPSGTPSGSPSESPSGSPSGTPSGSSAAAPSASSSTPVKASGCGSCTVISTQTSSSSSSTTRDGVLTSLAALAGVFVLTRRRRRG